MDGLFLFQQIKSIKENQFRKKVKYSDLLKTKYLEFQISRFRYTKLIVDLIFTLGCHLRFLKRSPMKLYFFEIIILFLIVSCKHDAQLIEKLQDDNRITFVGNYDDLNIEVTIKDVLPRSILDEEYTILKHNDTLIFRSKSRKYFKVGVRTTVLDNVILEKGDFVTVNVNKDSLEIEVKHSDLQANEDWLNSFHKTTEDHYQEIFAPIADIPDSNFINFLLTPLPMFNDYETAEFVYQHKKHVYEIDRDAYAQNKAAIDQKMRNKYIELDSMINNSNLDYGAKKILSNSLFNSTMDKFRRMGNTRHQWMYDEISKEIENDCDYTMHAINKSAFVLDHLTGKSYRNITILDLEKAYHQTKEIECKYHQRELQKMCLLRMFENGNNLNTTIDLLNDHTLTHSDSVFYSLVSDRFEFEEAVINGRGMNSVFVDLENKEFDYENLLKENIGKVILIDFWASWCGPCRKGIPHIKKLEQKYDKDKFKVIYASIDRYPNKWKKASKDDGINSKNNYWISDWINSDLYKTFEITHIPRYIIYDKSGNVAYQKPIETKVHAMEGIIEDLLDH